MTTHTDLQVGAETADLPGQAVRLRVEVTQVAHLRVDDVLYSGGSRKEQTRRRTDFVWRAEKILVRTALPALICEASLENYLIAR